MTIYIIKVEVWNDGKLRSSYIDLVFENKQDAEEHLNKCLEKDIFNNNRRPEIIEERVFKRY